jgi:hypothetical protein
MQINLKPSLDSLKHVDVDLILILGIVCKYIQSTYLYGCTYHV